MPCLTKPHSASQHLSSCQRSSPVTGKLPIISSKILSLRDRDYESSRLMIPGETPLLPEGRLLISSLTSAVVFTCNAHTWRTFVTLPTLEPHPSPRDVWIRVFKTPPANTMKSHWIRRATGEYPVLASPRPWSGLLAGAGPAQSGDAE